MNKICSNCIHWKDCGDNSSYTDEAGSNHRTGECNNGAFQECINLFRKDKKLEKHLAEAEMDFNGNNKAPDDSEFTWTTHEEFGCKFFEPIKVEVSDEGFINSEAKLVDIGWEHNAQSTAGFTEYNKTVDGVTWAWITRSAGNDYLMKDGEFVCHCESWVLLNEALDKYKLRD